jgi:UDP-N-acetylglucosamine:LPS N-acetylglucosamine transferase
MVLIPTPNHTEQLNNANKVKELGLARVVKQKNIKKSTLFTAVKRMLVEDKSEINKEIKEKTSGLKGLETAIAIILETALG